MVVDVGFFNETGSRAWNTVARGTATPTRKAVTASSVPSRNREEITEYRIRVNKLSMDLRASMSALAAANKEIARLKEQLQKCGSDDTDPSEGLAVLRRRVIHLKEENDALRAELSKAGGKKKRRRRKDESPSDEAVQPPSED